MNRVVVRRAADHFAAHLIFVRADTPEELDEGGFTHLAPHPQAFHSEAAADVPFAGNNTAPRNTYQSSTRRQAVARAFYRTDARPEPYKHTLMHPQAPTADTAVNRASGVNDWPLGFVPLVAFGPHVLTQEDGVVLNAGSVDRGMGGWVLLEREWTLVAHPATRRSEAEAFENPEAAGATLMKAAARSGDGPPYRHLEEDGLPRLGAVLRCGDIVIGRTVVELDVDNVRDGAPRRICRSLALRCSLGEEHRVDAAGFADDGAGRRVARVRTVTLRRPQVGDKYASRHAQKGVVSALVAQADMPFVTDGPNAGMTPDMLINAHS